MIWSKATTNLVERLDNFAKRMKMVPPQVDWDDIPTLREAAIELTRLRAIEKAALPFAHPDMGGQNEYGAWIGWQGLSKEGRIDRIRALRAALREKGAEE